MISIRILHLIAIPAFILKFNKYELINFKREKKIEIFLTDTSCLNYAMIIVVASVEQFTITNYANQ